MDRERGPGWGLVLVFGVLHLLCCGIPLLLLSGVSLQFLVPQWPVIGWALVVLGVVGFLWHLKRGCPTCPRNEGRLWLNRRCKSDECGTRADT